MPNNSIKTVAQEFQQQRDLLRVALGPYEDMRRAGFFKPGAQLGEELQRRDLVGRVVQEFQQQRDLAGRGVQEFQQQWDLVGRVVQEFQQQRDLLRVALGPYEDMRRAGFFKPGAQLGEELQRIRALIGTIEKQFYLPKVAEVTNLLRTFESDVAKVRKHYKTPMSGLRHALESMRTPWLDRENLARSVEGFVKLQGIGHALCTMHAFDPRLTDMLRIGLGDWREKIRWPSEIFSDPLARTNFYAERGLDPTLTAFPAKAFEQSVSIAGIEENLVPVSPAYDLEGEEGEAEEEIIFERNSKAHDRLQRFETLIRKFIDEMMYPVFGENWIKRQVPGEIRKKWLAKRQKAQENGERERPLIDYADFTDYVKIITGEDNWEKVFEAVFIRKTSVQESFQRLYPIRNCTMHARLITQDDELYLYAEIKRISAAIQHSYN